MPFREKTAWISLSCLLAAVAFYAGAWMFGFLPTPMDRFKVFFGCVAVIIVLRLILHLAAARGAPSDAATPADEREQLIVLKSARNTSNVLIAGLLMVPVILHLHLHIGLPEVIWIAVVTLIAGEVIRSASQILYFRRGT